jgi:hypothetical protein
VCIIDHSLKLYYGEDKCCKFHLPDGGLARYPISYRLLTISPSFISI